MKSRIDILKIVTWILMVVVIVSNIITLCYLVDYRENVPAEVRSIVDKSVKLASEKYSSLVIGEVTSQVDKLNVQNIISTSVDEKVNSLNLKNGNDGKDGKDSISTHTIETTKIIEQVPVNGKDGKDGVNGADGVDGTNSYIELRCNTNKNRWEIRYNEFDNWVLLNGKNIKCVVQ